MDNIHQVDRKERINSHWNELREETQLSITLLKDIFSKIKSYVDYINHTADGIQVNRGHLFKIQNFQLKVLAKLSVVNMDLENLFSDCEGLNLNQVHMTNIEHHDQNHESLTAHLHSQQMSEIRGTTPEVANTVHSTENSMIHQGIIGTIFNGAMQPEPITVQDQMISNLMLHKPHFSIKRSEIPKVGAPCLLRYIDSPTKFYIQEITGKTIPLDIISLSIENYVKNNHAEYSSKDFAFKDIHKFGVVYIEEYSHWYRMEVLDWYLNNQLDSCLVFLVDIGMTCNVSYKNMNRLNNELASIPMLVTCCHFHLFHPPNIGNTDCSDLIINQFTELVESLTINGGVEYFFRIAYSSWEDDLNSVAVDFYHIKSGNRKKTIGQILLNSGFTV